MLRLFNIYNVRSRCGWWVAESPERACQMAFEDGRARSIENLQAIEVDELDVVAVGYEQMLAGPEGKAFLEIPTETFAELLAALKAGAGRKKKESSRWGVHPHKAAPGENIIYGPPDS